MKSAPKRLWIFLAVLSFAGILKATLPMTVIGSWTAASNLSQPRANAPAVMLGDGRILITGGDSAGASLQAAEIFATDGTISSAAAMNVARSRHFAVALSDGRVLVGGGASGGGTTNSAEIYNPANDSWTQASPMVEARANATAALLHDGRVVIAGGDNSGTPSNTIEIFDPSTGNFNFAGTLSSARTQHAMAVLQDGRVLIVGGSDGTNPLASSDIFDPASGNVSVGMSLATARYSASATPLLNGTVAVIGGTGLGNSGAIDLASIEIFDPATGAFTDAGVSLATARSGHQAFLLPNNNNVLIFGGTSGGTAVASAELFTAQASPADGSWSYALSATGAMTTPRAVASGSANQVNGPTSAGQKTGLVIVGGGTDASGATLASTEIYAYPTVQTDQSDYPPGTAVTISGSGFKPGENVNITLIETPLIDTHGPYMVVADGNGNFTDSSFATDIHDLNVRFWVSAVGSQSGVVAQNTFTDATNVSTNTTLSTISTPLTSQQPNVPFSGTVSSSDSTHPLPAVSQVVQLQQFNNANCNGTATAVLGSVTVTPATPTISFNYSGTFTAPNVAVSTSVFLGAQYQGASQGSSSSAVNWKGSLSTCQTITVNPATVSTTTTIVSSANPSVFGQSITFTATVTPISGSTAPTGAIQFVVDGVNFGAPVTVAPCSPSPHACATSSSSTTITVSGSPHTVSANYTHTGNFTDSNGSLSGGQTVSKASTTSTVASNLNPSNYGQSVTFTATVAPVSPGSGTPSGTVQFMDGASAIGSTQTLNGSAQATFSTSALNATTHSITAVYSGDGNFNGSGTGGSTAPALSQVVKPVTLTASIVNDPTKPYDGNTNATLTSANYSLSGLVAPDSFTINQTSGTYNSKDVATAATVSATLATGDFIPGGTTSASNYTLPTMASGAGHITAVTLTGSIIGNPTKPYDGNTNATLTSANFSLTGVVVGESFTVTKTAGTYNSKDVATATTVTASLASTDLTAGGGTLASNYSLLTAVSGPGQITPKTLTASIIGNPSKTYDGSTAATLGAANFSLSGLISGESFTVTKTTGAYNSKDVATATTVTTSLIGTDFTPGSGTLSSNYTLPTTASGPGQITARPLTVSAMGVNKVYDGTTAATVTLSDNRISGDSITDAYTSASFADKNVGMGKPVSVSGISISGMDAPNYSLQNMTNATTANITPRPLTVSATGVNKQYDGNTTATVTLSDDRVSGDSLTDAYTSASFNNKNVGTAKPVSVSGISISGTDAGNYSLQNTTASTTANITARPLTITATGVDRVYDGTTTATVTLSDDRVTGDVFTDSYTSASFADKNAGTAKAIHVTGISVSGTDAGNYTFNATATATANITARPLKVYATGVDKTYDGTAVATVTLSDDRIAGDVIMDSYASASFADKNVGTAKAMSVSGISISGADAGNYNLQNATASTTANITPRPLAVSATGVNKIYDGTSTATVTLSDDRVSGDSVIDTYSSASFNNKNVGTAKPVSVSGISISGTDAANYALQNTTAGTTADITARPLTITATGVDRVYDGTTIATVILSDDRVSGDIFTSSYTSASFTDKNVGNSKPISVSGISLSGTDAGNYAFNTTATGTANITARPLNVYAAGVDKVYDGTTAATVTLSDNRVAGDIVTDGHASATFGDKNVATAKPVGVSGISISGTDAGNYALQNTTASTSANITPRDLTVTAHVVDKPYDGTTSATVTLSDDKVSGDSLTDNYTSATFADKNVANSKAVSVTGISISGMDAGNYNLLNTTASTTANISPRVLTITATGVSKVYDGTISATVTLSDNRLFGDVFTNSYTNAQFAEKNVGIAKQISVTGISISGTDAGNYTFNATAAATADITTRKITVMAVTDTKIYDGNTTSSAVPTVSYGSLAQGDTGNFSEVFDSRNVGARTLTPSGSVSDGNSGNNYAVVFKTANGTITSLAIIVTAVSDTKIYDGNTNSTGTPTISPALIAPDGPGFTQSFDSKNAGPRTLTPSGMVNDGNSGANYSYTFNTAAGTIAQRPVTVTADSQSKVYGGVDPPLTYAITAGSVVTGDGFTGGLSRASGENVSSYAILQGTLTLGSNYALNYIRNNLTITAAPLTITPDGGKTKVLGSVFTAFTSVVNGLKFTDAVNVTYTSPGAPASAAVGAYDITVGSYAFTVGIASNYSITLNKATGGLNVQYATGGMCAGDIGHAIRQPINPNGTSVFKQKSTVPAKFAVCNVSGMSIGTPGTVASFRLTGQGVGTVVPIPDEAVDSTTPDTAFRFDPTGQQWIFNMNTKGLADNMTYQYTIMLNDGSSIIFMFGLK